MDSGPRTTNRRRGPSLNVETPDATIINIASVAPETYNKAIECTIIGSSDDEKRTRELRSELAKQRSQLDEEEQKMKLFKDALKKDKLKYDKIDENVENDEKKVESMDTIEVRRLETSDVFQNFFQNASKVVERALSFSYDLTVDYLADGGDAEESKDEKLVRRNTLWNQKQTGTRAITSVSWNKKSKDQVLASYAGQENPMSLDPDGTVLIWNIGAPARPEYTFSCNSAVLICQFNPSNPNLIVGGCRSGVVVVWDIRAKKTPIDRTSLSRGHTYPVYALRCLPAATNDNLVSVSTDGMLCQWNDSNLHDPTNEIDLNTKLKEENKDSVTTDEITTTSLALPGSNSDDVLLASDEGRIYKTNVKDRKGIQEIIDAHDAPITNIQFHPTQRDLSSTSSVSDLFLTSSYDWTVKLWSNRRKKALFTFESARDYVFDVQWSTVHPAVFASGDGTGKLDVWNLALDTEVPTYSVQVEKDKGAISKLSWNEDGTCLAVAMSTGGIHVFDSKEELYNPSNEDGSRFYSRMNDLIDGMEA